MDRSPGHLLERPLECSSPAALREAPVTASRIRPRPTLQLLLLHHSSET